MADVKRQLELANAFASDTKHLADLLQRLLAVVQAKASRDNLTLTLLINSLQRLIDRVLNTRSGVMLCCLVHDIVLSSLSH